MTDLNFFRNNKRASNSLGAESKNFNIVIADTQWETFEALTNIRENFNFLNLSSEFAVNFILDYEKIDMVIISTKIGGLEEIINKAKRKNTKVYVLGRDLKYPVVIEEILSIIKNEFDKKTNLNQHITEKNGMTSLKALFKSRMCKNIFCKHEDNISTNVSALKKKHALKKSFNKKATIIEFDDNESADIDFEKTKTQDIDPERYGTKNNKYENNVLAKARDTEAQFYNNFWKEVTTEADMVDYANNRLVKPKRNKHEYQENGIKALKPGKSNFAKCDKEDFLDYELHSYKNNITDVRLKKNNFKIKNYKSSQADNTLIHSQNINNSGENRQEGNQNILEGKTQVPETGKVITIKQKTMVFIKAKGGVGSTFLSLYLAYEFRNLKTLLIDLNFSEGGSDVGYYLGMPKTPNMIIFTDGYNKISMDNSVISFKGHFDILQPPPSYDLTKKLDMQDIYSIVDIARKKYHLIIFDLPNQINDIFFGVLDMADLAIMVSDYTPGSINRLASINKRFIYNDMERILVLNKNKNKSAHRFIKNNISEFFSLKEIVNIDENSFLSGKSDFYGYDFSNNKGMQGFKKKVFEALTFD